MYTYINVQRLWEGAIRSKLVPLSALPDTSTFAYSVIDLEVLVLANAHRPSREAPPRQIARCNLTLNQAGKQLASHCSYSFRLSSPMAIVRCSLHMHYTPSTTAP